MIRRYPSFPSDFIHTAILLSLFAGITLGSHVVYLIGFDLSLGPGYYSFIQSHGHIQLMGWAGLFIMGVSLHFLPRLTHIKINDRYRPDLILGFMTSGLFLRIICQCWLPYLNGSPWFSTLSILIVFSGILTIISIIYYLLALGSIIKKSIQDVRKINRNIQIFILLTIVGWVIYSLGDQVLLIEMFMNRQSILLQNWNGFLIDLFIHFTIFSICMAVGIRTLPLFMRLPAITWNVKIFSQIYAILLFIIFGGRFINQFIYYSLITNTIYISSILKDALIMWFIININIIFKTRPPWVDTMDEEKVPHRKEARKNLPDYGEFGRFEWLIKPAFLWLFTGLFLDIIIQYSLLTKRITEISTDGVRHIFLLGFISHLIMGMAVRMIPGMAGIRKLTKPHWVAPLAILSNVAVFQRVFILVLPVQVLSSLPGHIELYNRLFGISGILFLIGLGIFYYIMFPVLKYRKDD